LRMMKKKTPTKMTKRTSDPFAVESAFRHIETVQHPFTPTGHRSRCMRRLIFLLALIWSPVVLPTFAAPAGAQSSSNPKNSHAHDFIIFATVFRDQGFALPGARIRVRRATEKKFRWEATSDRSGEFGIRVPQDAEYEATIEARGYKPQTRKIDAHEGNREDLTIQMERLDGGKS